MIRRLEFHHQKTGLSRPELLSLSDGDGCHPYLTLVHEFGDCRLHPEQVSARVQHLRVEASGRNLKIFKDVEKDSNPYLQEFSLETRSTQPS